MTAATQITKGENRMIALGGFFRQTLAFRARRAAERACFEHAEMVKESAIRLAEQQARDNAIAKYGKEYVEYHEEIQKTRDRMFALSQKNVANLSWWERVEVSMEASILMEKHKDFASNPVLPNSKANTGLYWPN